MERFEYRMSVWSALSATLCTSPDLELGYGNLRYLELLRLGATLTGCSRVPCGVVVCARRTVYRRTSLEDSAVRAG